MPHAEGEGSRPRSPEHATLAGPVLVTGAAGFIGSHLVRALVGRGVATFALDARPVERDLGAEESFVFDIRDHEPLSEVVRRCRPQVVFHLAAESSVVRAERDPVASRRTNVTATYDLARLSTAHGARRFVFFSTGGAMYGDPRADPVTEDEGGSPRSIYGASKLAAEELLGTFARRGEIEVSVLRPANVYGPGQDPHGESGVVAIFTERMLEGRPVTIFGDGSQRRDYIHVDDVVAAALGAAVGRPATCNVSTGRSRSTLDVFHTLAEACGYRQPPHFAAARPEEIPGCALNPDLARRAWGWEPSIPFEDGIRATVAWYRAKQLHATV